MNTIILKILCWINGIKNPFAWAYEQEIKKKREMTAEEYRQKMIQAFHNADCDELIAICVLPTEKEFEHLEWLLKNHYKKEPSGDAISRQSAIFLADDLKQDLPDDEHITDMVMAHNEGILEYQTQLSLLSPVTPQPKMGHWIYTEYHTWCCSECGGNPHKGTGFTPNKDGMKMRWKYCNLCGARMESEG